MNEYYLAHIPHSGIIIPEKYKKDYLIKDKELNDNILKYSDLYTNELFEDIYFEFGGIINKYSRLFFDPERFSNDEDEEMHLKYKLGWFYENTPLKEKKLRKTKNKNKIFEYYLKHHEILNNKVEKKISKYNKCTIIDCHSFSNNLQWFQEKKRELPEICIGFDEFHKDKKLVEEIKKEFKDFNLKINTPYSGSLVPIKHYNENKKVKSIMIEINKKLYLEEDEINKNKSFKELKNRIKSLNNRII